MKKTKLVAFVFFLMLMAASVLAQPANLPADLKPGMTPDSPFYFLDTLFDGLQSSESLADEKAAEVVMMAHENKVEAMEKARERYSKAMEKRNRESQGDEERAEAVMRQASRHMEVLANVYENAPEAAKQGLEMAMKRSAEGRENALRNFSGMNAERARVVAQETSNEILDGSSERARMRLQTVMNTAGEMPEEPLMDGMMPEEPLMEEQQSGEQAGSENVMDAGSKAKGDFKLLVSDAPADINDFEQLIVKLSKARIFSGEGDNNSFENKELDSSVDLTKLVGDASMEVLATELEVGSYSKVELYVDSVDAKVNNETADVMVPSGKLQIVKPFEILDGEETKFVFDINVIKKGQGNEYNLLPVIAKSGVVGKDLEEDEVEEVECSTVEDCDEGYECVENKCEEMAE